MTNIFWPIFFKNNHFPWSTCCKSSKLYKVMRSDPFMRFIQINRWPKRTRRLFNSLYLIKEQRKYLSSLKQLLSLLLNLALVGFFQILYFLLVNAFNTRCLFNRVFYILFYMLYLISNIKHTLPLKFWGAFKSIFGC